MAIGTLLRAVFFTFKTHCRNTVGTMAEILYTSLLYQMQATVALAAFLSAMLVASCAIDSNAAPAKATIQFTRPTR